MIDDPFEATDAEVAKAAENCPEAVVNARLVAQVLLDARRSQIDPAEHCRTLPNAVAEATRDAWNLAIAAVVELAADVVLEQRVCNGCGRIGSATTIATVTYPSGAVRHWCDQCEGGPADRDPGVG